LQLAPLGFDEVGQSVRQLFSLCPAKMKESWYSMRIPTLFCFSEGLLIGCQLFLLLTFKTELHCRVRLLRHLQCPCTLGKKDELPVLILG
jgi:hypothetical protein